MNTSEIRTFGKLFREFCIRPDTNTTIGLSAALIADHSINIDDVPDPGFDDPNYMPFIFEHPIFVLSACAAYGNLMENFAGNKNATIVYNKYLPNEEMDVLMLLVNAIALFDTENPSFEEFAHGFILASIIADDCLPEYIDKFFADVPYFEVPLDGIDHQMATKGPVGRFILSDMEKAREVYQIVVDLYAQLR